MAGPAGPVRRAFNVALALAVVGRSAAAQARPTAGSAAGAPISVALVGQALIKNDNCVTAPAAVEQAKGYLAGVDVKFTNLEVAIAPDGRQLTPRTPTTVPAPEAVLDCLKTMGFNILSLANNHAFDLRAEGLLATSTR